MARRRQDSLLDDLFKLLLSVPWWCGPVLAGVVYVFFRFVLPLTLGGSTNPMVSPTVQMLRMLTINGAPFAALVVLVIWGVAELRKQFDRKRLESQTGIESIRRLPWREFELLLFEAFRRQGYQVDHTGGGGADGGIDLVLRRAGARTIVQCKQWRWESVGVKPVRELLGVVTSEGAAYGIFVTSGSYTEDATAFAARNPALTLIDGAQLEALIRAVQTERTASSANEPQGYQAEESLSSVPVCPLCSAAMIRRTARKGPKAGSQFWGCSKYPACRGIRE